MDYLALLAVLAPLILMTILSVVLKLFGSVMWTVMGRWLTDELKEHVDHQFTDVNTKIEGIKVDTDYLRNNGVETRTQLNNHGVELIDLRRDHTDIRDRLRRLERKN